MTTDYEKYYSENRHGLGEPTKEFVDFFDQFDRNDAVVLDVGCGQGRDALFIARLGHAVTAIDLSPSGIRDLSVDARAEGLSIVTKVVDIRDYNSNSRFDVIIIDRTLHMLAADEQTTVLRTLLGLSKKGCHVLIADEKSNFPAFIDVFDNSEWSWTSTLERRGFYFAVRD